ncbi:MAG: ABC transporter substrate-binding protein [Lapillicoccus sp.]
MSVPRRTTDRRPRVRLLLNLVATAALLLSLGACAQKPGEGGGGASGGGGGTAPAGGGPASGGTVRMGVGGQPLLVYLPTTLAQQLGYYKEAGVDVQLDDLQGGSKALQALQGGSVDVVSGFYDHTIQMAAKGKEVKAFVGMLQYPSVVLAVSPKAKKPIKTIKDLQGATVGVTAPGSSTDFFLKFLLRKNGLSPDAAPVVAIGGDATAVAAMENGKVDAAVMIDPSLSQLQKRVGKDNLVILSDTRTAEGVQNAFGVSTYPAAVLYSTGDWINKNPDTARKLAGAIQRTLTWIQGHSAEEIAAKMPPQYAGDDKSVYVASIEAAKKAYSPDGKIHEDGAKEVLSVLKQSIPEVGSATIDLSKTYTNEYLAK